ncbi:hypothetical protein SSS_05507 [Sarcoptes scabiei]|uniref:Uncharacterized protein n=1 Tax=Sarcoptes scabiei TaxID=52283 RepID=A0A834VDR8_SARSC|nr:hypothetical protein SSS_05507 [Sarcoptes scabiei]
MSPARGHAISCSYSESPQQGVSTFWSWSNKCTPPCDGAFRHVLALELPQLSILSHEHIGVPPLKSYIDARQVKTNQCSGSIQNDQLNTIACHRNDSKQWYHPNTSIKFKSSEIIPVDPITQAKLQDNSLSIRIRTTGVT